MQIPSMTAKMLGTVSAFAVAFGTSQALAGSPGPLTSSPEAQHQQIQVADISVDVGGGLGGGLGGESGDDADASASASVSAGDASVSAGTGVSAGEGGIGADAGVSASVGGNSVDADAGVDASGDGVSADAAVGTASDDSSGDDASGGNDDGGAGASEDNAGEDTASAGSSDDGGGSGGLNAGANTSADVDDSGLGLAAAVEGEGPQDSPASVSNETEIVWNSDAAAEMAAARDLLAADQWRTMISLVQSAQAAADVAARSATTVQSTTSPEQAQKANGDAQAAAEAAIVAATKVRTLAEKYSGPTGVKNAILASQTAALSAQIHADVASTVVAEKTAR